MFESDLDKNSGKLQRRTFLALSGSAAAAALFWSLRKPVMLAAATTGPQTPVEVTIVEFSDDGKRLKKSRVAKVVETATLDPGSIVVSPPAYSHPYT